MKKTTVKLIDPMGFHARPLGVAVNTLREYDCEGYIYHAGREINMESVVRLLGMDVPTGSTFMFVTDGEKCNEGMHAMLDNLKEIGFIEEVE